MCLVYDDTSVGPPFKGGSIANWNPLPPYLKHYENYLYLKFVLAKGNLDERFQASKELKICDRKLAFWTKHPNWDPSQAAVEVNKLKARWKG